MSVQIGDVVLYRMDGGVHKGRQRPALVLEVQESESLKDQVLDLAVVSSWIHNQQVSLQCRVGALRGSGVGEWQELGRE